MAAGAALLTLLGPGLARAAPPKFPDFPPPPADKLKTATSDGLSVGVFVMDDPVDQKTYFETDLKHAFITPLWVSVANASAGQRFWFDIAEMQLSDHSTFASSGDSVDERGGTALVVTDLFAGTLVLGLIGESMLADASRAKKNMIDRGLGSHTLGPGQQASGFVYVRRDKANPTVAGCSLVLAAHETPPKPGAAPILCTVSL